MGTGDGTPSTICRFVNNFVAIPSRQWWLWVGMSHTASTRRAERVDAPHTATRERVTNNELFSSPLSLFRAVQQRFRHQTRRAHAPHTSGAASEGTGLRSGEGSVGGSVVVLGMDWVGRKVGVYSKAGDGEPTSHQKGGDSPGARWIRSGNAGIRSWDVPGQQWTVIRMVVLLG